MASRRLPSASSSRTSLLSDEAGRNGMTGERSGLCNASLGAGNAVFGANCKAGCCEMA